MGGFAAMGLADAAAQWVVGERDELAIGSLDFREHAGEVPAIGPAFAIGLEFFDQVAFGVVGVVGHAALVARLQHLAGSAIFAVVALASLK